MTRANFPHFLHVTPQELSGKGFCWTVTCYIPSFWGYNPNAVTKKHTNFPMPASSSFAPCQTDMAREGNHPHSEKILV